MLGPKYGLEGISADLIEKTINRIPMSIVNLNPTCFTANTKQTMKQPMPPIPVMTLSIPYPTLPQAPPIYSFIAKSHLYH